MSAETPSNSPANIAPEAESAPSHVLFSFAQGEVMQGTLKGTDRDSEYPAPPFLMAAPGAPGASATAAGNYMPYPMYAPHPAYPGFAAYPGYPPYPPHPIQPHHYPPGMTPVVPYPATLHHDYDGPMQPSYPAMTVDVENPSAPLIQDHALQRRANVVRFISLLDVFFSSLTLFIGYWFGAVGIAMGLVGYYGATYARVFYVLLYTIYLAMMLLADVVTLAVAAQVMDLNATTVIFFVLRIAIQAAILNYVRKFYVGLRDYVNIHGQEIPQDT